MLINILIRPHVTPCAQHTLKLVAGTLVVVALVINFFERWYAPQTLVLESSSNFPAWIGWAGWGLAVVAALTYFSIDFLEGRRGRTTHAPEPSPKAITNATKLKPPLTRGLLLLLLSPTRFLDTARPFEDEQTTELQKERARMKQNGEEVYNRLLALRRIADVRRAWCYSTLYVLLLVIIGWTTGALLAWLFGPAPENLPALLQYIGVGILLLTTLARSGWAIQTIGGKSLLERTDARLYRIFYIVGSFSLILSVSWPAR
jgi:hypothetical protein